MKIEAIYKDIGAIIRAKRRSKEMSQEKLADRLGISRATLANIETGRQRILTHQLYAFGDVLGMEPSELLPVRPTVANVAGLTFSQDDLNPEQKKQIAQLIGQVQLVPADPKEEPHAQPRTNNAGDRRRGTA